jgi:KaiC/GvpD/RAD55 family RecA-like ATPase
LFYPGKLNMLFAPSESGKTLVSLYTCVERMQAGERVVYVDFEDDPVNTILRLRQMGASDDDLRLNFTYIRPDQPIATMQRDNWGNMKYTPVGEANAHILAATLEQTDPALIIADGMTSVYGLHGLDSNNSVQTDVITNWLKSLTRGGRTTVIIIDHMAKTGERGSMPIGSQHKVAMVQGTLLQVWPKDNKGPRLGAKSELELIVLKDRPGQVRQFAGQPNGKAQVAALVEIDSTQIDGRGQVITTFSIKVPSSTVGSTSGTAASGALMQVDAGTSKAFQAAEMKELMELLYLAPYKGQTGLNLKHRVIYASVKSRWDVHKWTKTAFDLTRVRLVKSSYLMQNGGNAGPTVTYELTSTGADWWATTLKARQSAAAGSAGD